MTNSNILSCNSYDNNIVYTGFEVDTSSKYLVYICILE